MFTQRKRLHHFARMLLRNAIIYCILDMKQLLIHVYVPVYSIGNVSCDCILKLYVNRKYSKSMHRVQICPIVQLFLLYKDLSI